MGLYNGETSDIAKRKGLRYREDILDNVDYGGIMPEDLPKQGKKLFLASKGIWIIYLYSFILIEKVSVNKLLKRQAKSLTHNS